MGERMNLIDPRPAQRFTKVGRGVPEPQTRHRLAEDGSPCLNQPEGTPGSTLAGIMQTRNHE